MLCNSSTKLALVTGIGLCCVSCTDAAVNAGSARLDDVAMACTPTPREYRLTAVDPSSRVAKQLDLDGDGTLDDRLGMAHDALVASEPAFAVAPRFTARLANDVVWLVAVDRCGDDVRFTIARGFTLDSGPWLAERGEARAVGAPLGDAAGTIEARDGRIEVPLVALADPGGTLGPGWTAADGAIVRAVVNDDSIAGIFVAAIDTDVARAELAPPIATFFASLPVDDPVRGAATARDGTITADAIAASELFQELVVGDVVVRAPDGTPRGDGAKRASIAFAFSGTRVR
jgi:hypothetical protein